MRDKKMPKKRIARIVVLLVLVAVVAGACSWINAHTPVEDSPEEYAYHMELIEGEELLGKTKQEVYDLIGYPDVWYEVRLSMAFPKGLDIWNEKVHVWVYGTRNDTTDLSFDLFFSDEGTVDYCAAYWEDLETAEIRSEKQGTPNKYFTLKFD